jgi:hypothetical protein
VDQAETGVGPAIASGNQVYKGIWADLPVAPTNNNNVIPVSTAGAVSPAREKIAIKSVVPYWPNIQNIASRKTKITDPVHHKSFLRRIIVVSVLKPIADQQIRTQTNTFPTDKHDYKIGAEHQH